MQRKPTQLQHGPLSGNAGVCVDLDHHECSYHDGKAFLAGGCGLPVVGSTGIDTHTNLPLLSGNLDGAPVEVLRDTGCNGVIVRTCLVNPKQMTGQTKVLVRIDKTSIMAPGGVLFSTFPSRSQARIKEEGWRLVPAGRKNSRQTYD